MKIIQIDRLKPFPNIDSWKAYVSFFYNNKPEGSSLVCDQILQEIIPTQVEKEINVLILGVGVGCFEFPLLAQLERNTKRKVRIVAIDANKEPLNFATKLIASGLDSLPVTSDDMVKRLDESDWQTVPENNSWKHGLHLFVCDNLDFDEGRTEDDHVAHTAQASRWKERLQRSHEEFIPKAGFDIVLASFFLPHITWWRYCLVASLELLREGGVFMHSRVTGDAEMLEGRTSNVKSILNKLGNPSHIKHSNKIMEQIFLSKDGFYGDAIVKKYENFPRPATPIRPFAIDRFIKQLINYGLDEYRSSYLIQNKVNKCTYINLLEKRNSSSFRVVENEITGATHYEYLIDYIKNKVKSISEDECDILLLEYTWSICKLVSKSKALTSPIAHKFIGSIQHPIKHNSHDFIRAEKYYEAQEAKFITGVYRSEELTEVQEKFVKNAISSGAISSLCIGGLMVSLIDQLAIRVFANSLHKYDSTRKKKFFQELYFYLFFREEGYSNTSTLLKELLPNSGKTCVFVCKRSTSANQGKPLIDLNIIQHPDFKEIQFILSEEVVNRVSEFQMNSDYIKESKISLLLKISSMDTHYGNFSEVLSKEKGKGILQKGGLQEQAKMYLDIDNSITYLRQKIDEIGGESSSFSDALKKNITDKLLFGILFIPIISDFYTSVTYPIDYRFDGSPQADDAIILFYDSHFSTEQIEHEYDKIHSMGDHTLIPNSTLSLGRRYIAEELGHEIRWVNHFCQIASELLETQGLDSKQTKNLKKLKKDAHSYIDLWANNQENVDYDIKLNEIISTAKSIGLIQRFRGFSEDEVVKDVDLFVNFFTNRLLVEIITHESPISLGRSQQVRKAILAALSNAIFHTLPSNIPFDDFLRQDIVFKLIITLRNDAVVIYNHSESGYIEKKQKQIGTLNIIKNQLRDLKGAVKMKSINSKDEFDLQGEASDDIQRLSFPIVRTYIYYHLDEEDNP